jgi:hypothetical protein
MKRVLLGSFASVVAGAAGALFACATSPALRAAESGDRSALASAVAGRERIGNLSNGEAATLAGVVAEREVRSASGPDAVDRVRDVRPCAHELDAALAARSATHDEAGAEAALARLEAGGLSAGDARVFVSDADPHWRAVGMRGLARPQDQPARMRALLDADPGVRRAAARAAGDARDAADRAPLADAARRDPEPIVRTEAVRALAALPATPDGATANILRDLWSDADDGLREDIAIAWSHPEVWTAGGREALRILIASAEGAGAVEAAAAVLRRRDAPDEVTASAVAHLARAMEGGTTANRLQALAESPAGLRELQSVVLRLADGDDAEIQVAALARLSLEKDPKAVEKLEGLARPGSAVGERARLALASAGDRRVQAWIESDLAASDSAERLAAATALAALGVSARAAPLLADANVHVRLRAACTILMAARRP